MKVLLHFKYELEEEKDTIFQYLKMTTKAYDDYLSMISDSVEDCDNANIKY